MRRFPDGGPALLDRFSALDAPRQRGKVLYPLPEIMLLMLCATLAGAEDFVEMRFWPRKACFPEDHAALQAGHPVA